MKNTVHKLLRWSERYTKTDMTYLMKGGFWLTINSIIAMTASLLLSVAFANLLPKEVFGTYKFVLSAMTLLTIPTLQNMSTAVVQSVSRGHDAALMQALYAKLRWGTLATLLSLGVAEYYYLNNNIELAISFLIVAVFAPFINTLNIYDGLLSGKKQFKQASMFRVFADVLSLVVLGTTLFLTDNLFLILLAFLLPYTLARLAILRIVKNRFMTNENTDPRVVSYGKHLSVIGTIDTIANHLDKVILWHFLGPVAVAVLTFAESPVKQLRGLLKSISSLAFPKFATADIAILKQTLPGKIMRLTILLIVPIGVYILLAPILFKLLFPQYLDAVLPTQLFSLALLLYPRTLLKTALTARQQTKQLYLIDISTSAARIVLILALIPLYGVLGAVAASLATQTIGYIMLKHFFDKTD